MKHAVAAVLVLAALGSGCKKDGAATVPGGLIKSLAALDAEGCACKDMACADQVSDKVTKLGQANADFDEADLPRLQALQGHLDSCLAKLNPVIVAYLAITDEACACTDKACATKVAGKVSKWAADLKANKTKLRGNDAGVAMKAGAAAAECFTRQGVPIPQ
jgi:hypothetical protein